MSIGILISAIAVILGSGGIGVIVTALVNSRHNKAKSETEARAQFSAEFDVLATNLSSEIRRQDEKIERQDTKIEQLNETVSNQGNKITRLERRESSFRAYIYRLIAQIRGLGAEPVEPPVDLEL